MGTRTRTAPRCARCRLLEPLCVCGLAVPSFTRTQVICVVHAIEAKKPTNTSHLLPLALPGAECRVRGERDAEPLVTDDFVAASRRPLLLFPCPEARRLDARLLAEDERPVRLLVPDGTWTQASRLTRRLTAWSNVERVSLPAGEPSQYRLRTSTMPEALCTFEAVAEALCIIEGEHLREPLLQLLGAFIDRTLWSRGDLSAARVRGGITREMATWVAPPPAR